MRKLSEHMKQKNIKKHWVVGAALVCVATTSAALTLGRARGAILLGQPLSVTVAIQADTDDAAADLCFDADVYYGDIRQDTSRVSVTPVRQESGAPNAVRVNVASPIDEPIVTVYLRSGCGQKTSRKYVLLSELASDVAPALVGESAVRSPRPAQVPTVKAQLPAPSAVQPPTSSTPSTASQPSAVTKKPPAVKRKSAKERDAAAPGVATPSKSRLKLSILHLVDVKDPALKLSNELSSLPSEDPLKREAAVALWRSLNTSPQDLISDEARQKTLVDDLKSVRDLSTKNQKELEVLSSRLQQAESERFSNPLVYALGALLVMMGLALAALFLKLRRSGDDSPWWRSDSVQGDNDDEITLASDAENGLSTPANLPFAASKTAVFARPPQASPTVEDFSNSGLDIDLDLDELPTMVVEAPQPLKRKELTAAVSAKDFSMSGPGRELSHSVHASLHAINTKEMLDIRQQADFFMTLGQHEEAISLLEGHIRENDTSNPLVYLDLLKVLHTLSRKPPFDHYRNDFNAIFTGRAPAYTNFGQAGNSLDAYPQICQEISALWGTETAVDFLEQCLVRRPEDAPEMFFDLDAFRDLLLLHAVASRTSLNKISDSGLMPFSALKMPPTPQADELSLVVTPEGMTEMTMPVKPVQPMGHELAVDLDLSSDDHNLIDFDASGLTDLVKSAKDTPPKH